MLLKGIFGSADKERVLQYLFLKNGYAAEIASFWNVPKSQISKQLQMLEREGIIVGIDYGLTRVFEFNPNYYFLNEIKALLERAKGAYTEDIASKLDELRYMRKKPRKKGKERVVVPREQTGSFEYSIVGTTA